MKLVRLKEKVYKYVSINDVLENSYNTNLLVSVSSPINNPEW